MAMRAPIITNDALTQAAIDQIQGPPILPGQAALSSGLKQQSVDIAKRKAVSAARLPAPPTTLRHKPGIADFLLGASVGAFNALQDSAAGKEEQKRYAEEQAIKDRAASVAERNASVGERSVSISEKDQAYKDKLLKRDDDLKLNEWLAKAQKNGTQLNPIIVGKMQKIMHGEADWSDPEVVDVMNKMNGPELSKAVQEEIALRTTGGEDPKLVSQDILKRQLKATDRSERIADAQVAVTEAQLKHAQNLEKGLLDPQTAEANLPSVRSGAQQMMGYLANYAFILERQTGGKSSALMQALMAKLQTGGDLTPKDQMAMVGAQDSLKGNKLASQTLETIRTIAKSLDRQLAIQYRMEEMTGFGKAPASPTTPLPGMGGASSNGPAPVTPFTASDNVPTTFERSVLGQAAKTVKGYWDQANALPSAIPYVPSTGQLVEFAKNLPTYVKKLWGGDDENVKDTVKFIYTNHIDAQGNPSTQLLDRLGVTPEQYQTVRDEHFSKGGNVDSLKLKLMVMDLESRGKTAEVQKLKKEVEAEMKKAGAVLLY